MVQMPGWTGLANARVTLFGKRHLHQLMLCLCMSEVFPVQ